MGPLGHGRQPNQMQTDSNWQGLFSQALEFLSCRPVSQAFAKRAHRRRRQSQPTPHTLSFPFTVSSPWHPSQPPLAPSRALQHHEAQSDACPRPPSARPTARMRAPSAARSPPPRSPTSATTPPRMAPTRTSCTNTSWLAPWARSPRPEPSPRSKVSRDEQLLGAETAG